MIIKKPKPLVSKNAIRRLRLKEGDIVVVKKEATMQALAKGLVVPKGTPDCLVIVAPEGILRLNREWLLKKLNAVERSAA